MIRGDDCINADGGSGANGQLKIDYSIFTAQVSVTSISPNKGLISPYSAGANRTVTITGNFADVDFAQPYSITFGGTAATIISGSSSQIVVSYPDWATAGAVDVRIAFTDNSYGFTDWDYSLGSFTYEAPYLNINPSTPETLTISYSPSDVLPPNGVFAVKTAKTVSTNNPLGYTLTMAPQSGTNLVCATNGSLTINTIGSAGALSVGTYGYKTATSDQTGINTGWNPVSSNQQIKNVPSPIENDPINVWFGVRLAPNVAPCSSYSQTFVWTLTPNV
jgi:hypothetical protein